MVNTAIGIKSAMMDRAGQEDRAMEEYSEELCGILSKIEEAKDMLAQLTDEMDDKDRSTEDVDEAMDALDDAIDILGDLI